METENGNVSSDSAIIPDPFWELGIQARAAGTPLARVTINVGCGEEYGRVKCSTTVSLECPQSKGALDQAAALAFETALGYTNDGMSHLVDDYVAIPFIR